MPHPTPARRPGRPRLPGRSYYLRLPPDLLAAVEAAKAASPDHGRGAPLAGWLRVLIERGLGR